MGACEVCRACAPPNPAEKSVAGAAEVAVAPPRPVKEKPEAVPAALEVAVGARLVPPRLKPVVPVLCVAPPNEKPLALVAVRMKKTCEFSI